MEHTKETRTRDCEINRGGNNSITYDNEGKEKTSSTSDQEDKEATNVRNGILNIY